MKMMHEECKMNEKMKLKHNTNIKRMLQSIKNMLRMMEHDMDLGMTWTQEHVICAKRSKKT